jgi:predicted nucleic acid-binding protein
MTKNVVFDSYALIAHFRDEQGADLISNLLSEMVLEEKTGFISVINIGEVYYMLYKKAGLKNAEKALEVIKTFPIEVAPADYDFTCAAARLKSRFKVSYADAFAAALTIQKKGTLITGDPEFKSLSKEKDFKVHFINR